MGNMGSDSDFSVRLSTLIATLEKRALACKTEEATKMGLIVPMLQVWGYDPFNPLEVVPEYNADVGTKKKEKVDYAILDSEGNPVMLIECKAADASLDSHGGQLFRYFSVTPAKIGILTNGLEYRFFSDTEAENKMDLKPFLILNLTSLKAGQENQLKRFCKSDFNIDDLVPDIEKLARKRRISDAISDSFTNPDEDLIKYFINKTYDGKMVTKKVIEEWTPLIKDGIRNYFNESVSARLMNALDDVGDASEEPTNATSDGIVTTEEEISAYRIIQAICSEVVPSDKVVMRDAKSYCAILYDDNNRKPIIRFYFDSKTKYVVTFNVKEGNRTNVSKPEDLFSIREDILAAVKQYLV